MDFSHVNQAEEPIANIAREYNSHVHVGSHIKSMAPYQAGKPIAEIAREYNLDPSNIIKLASNENPLGMPEASRLAMLRALATNSGELAQYPDANGFELKAKLAAHHEVPEDWITLGNGSNDILEMAAHTFLQPSQSAIYSQYAFAVYALATQAIGAERIVVPARDFGHDLDAMYDAVKQNTALIFIANPNNPTGTFLKPHQIEAFLKQIFTQYADTIKVVLDEAYNEYLHPEDRFNSMLWVQQFPNLIVSRTFSKAYGLASLRVGFAVAQAPLTNYLNRIRQPFNVNTLAQLAASAALSDQDFLKQTYDTNLAGYQQLTQGFEQRQLTFLPSAGNFVLLKVGNADFVNQQLLKQGIIVRPVANYGLSEWLRISIGLPEQNAAFLDALDKILT